MLDGFQPAIRFAIMSILSALYESGTVEEVDLVDIMRLFGIQPSADEEAKVVSFRDEGWIESYIDFREQEFDEEEALEREMEPGEDVDLARMPADKKLH